LPTLVSLEGEGSPCPHSGPYCAPFGTSRRRIAFPLLRYLLSSIEGALALIRPDVHQILGAHGVLERPERHSVLLTEGAVLLLYYFSLLLQGGATGIRKRVDSPVEKEKRAHGGRGPRNLIAAIDSA
jgi:hypothetical protein